MVIKKVSEKIGFVCYITLCKENVCVCAMKGKQFPVLLLIVDGFNFYQRDFIIEKQIAQHFV